MSEKIEITSTFDKKADDKKADKIIISFPSEKIHFNFHCNDKEDFAYDFYWNLAKIERQKILDIDDNFIIENFLTQLKIKGLEEHEVLHRKNQKERQIKAEIANLIAAALAYRIKIRRLHFQNRWVSMFRFFIQAPFRQLKEWYTEWKSKQKAKKLQEGQLWCSVQRAFERIKKWYKRWQNKIAAKWKKWYTSLQNKIPAKWKKKWHNRQNKIAAKEIQEKLSGKSNEILKKIAEMRLTVFEDITFTDQKVIFTFDKKKDDTADFHKESDYFLHDFLFVYNLDPERIQNIVEDLWKVLVNEQYLRFQRYILATNFINAFNLKDSQLLREKNQYEYLRWHKERYKIALELYDEEKIKESARAWVNLLADEEEHAFIDQYCDREEEMANVIFGAPSNEEPSKATDYLYELEKDKKALQSLSAWFLRRYCIGTGIRIIWDIIRQDKKLLILSCFFLVLLFSGIGIGFRLINSIIVNSIIGVVVVIAVVLVKRLTQGNHKSDRVIFYEKSLCRLLLLCPILYFGFFVLIRYIYKVSWTENLVFLDLTFVSLFFAFSLLGLIFFKVNIFRLFLPRVLMGIVIGWLAFLTTEELWKYTVFLSPLKIGIVGILLLCLIGIYIFTEINNKIKSGWKSFIRSSSILFLGLIEALIIGMLACGLMGKTMIENSGILAKSNISELHANQNKRFTRSIQQIKDEPDYQYKDKQKKEDEYNINVLGEISFLGNLKLLHRQKLWEKKKYEFRIYPSILFIRSIFALFVGVVLQLLWEDKPMTEPL